MRRPARAAKLALWAALAMAAMHSARAQSPDDPSAAMAACAEGCAACVDAQCENGRAFDPEDADGWLRHGLALAAADKFDEARQAFEQTLALAPDYVDAHLGLARLALWQGRFDDAEGHARHALALEPYRKEAATLVDQIAAARPRRWRIDLDGGISNLSGGRASWRESAARFGLAATPETTVTALFQLSERFETSDRYAEVRADHRFDDSLSAYFALGITPNATFLPERAIKVGGAARVSQGSARLGPTILSLDSGYADYPDSEIVSLRPGAAQYLLEGRLWLTGRLVASFDDAGSAWPGYIIRADLLPTDGLTVNLGWSDAPELDAGAIVDVRTVFGGFAVDLPDGITLRLAGAYERRPEAYTRTTATLGITFRF